VEKVSIPQGKHLNPIPTGPKGHWLLGVMPDINRDPLGFFQNTSQYGPIFSFRFFIWSGIMVNHPDYIKHILQENYKNYTKQTHDYQLMKPIVGAGLLTSEGDFWLRQRRLIQPAFHRHRIQSFGTLMADSTLQMLERWQSEPFRSEPFDVSNEMMRLTLSIVGKALFSQDLSHEAEAVGRSFTVASDYTSRKLRSVVLLSGGKEYRQAISELDRVVMEIIAERRSRKDRIEEDRNEDLLDMLLNARDEDTGQGMTDKQLRDEVITLLLAGHETTANALSWTWYLLSENPDVYHRLQAELKTILNGRIPEMDDLPNLPYTRMVIQESMRLYPPAWIISRRAESEDIVDGYRIPSKSILHLSSYVMHRNPDYWDKPEVFDPERFCPERSIGRPAFAYFPFGGGPRLCIGRDFAMAEAQLILATVASRCRLELVPGHPVVPDPQITLRLKHGLQMLKQEVR